MEKYIVKVNGREYEVEIEKADSSVSHTEQLRKAETVAASAPKVNKTEEKASGVSSSVVEGVNYLEAGAAGKVFKIVKKAGETVSKGDTIIILEAMKMEIPMVSPWDGTINEILVNEGQPVEAGDRLAAVI